MRYAAGAAVYRGPYADAQGNAGYRVRFPGAFLRRHDHSYRDERSKLGRDGKPP